LDQLVQAQHLRLVLKSMRHQLEAESQVVGRLEDVVA
jgi:hypothetical protein